MNGAVVLTSFVLPAAGVFPVIFTLDLSKTLYPGNLKIFSLLSKTGASL